MPQEFIYNSVGSVGEELVIDIHRILRKMEQLVTVQTKWKIRKGSLVMIYSVI